MTSAERTAAERLRNKLGHTSVRGTIREQDKPEFDKLTDAAKAEREAYLTEKEQDK